MRGAIGFEIYFGEDRVTVNSTNVADNQQLAAKLSLPQRLFSALRRGPKTLAALTDETGGTLETIERTVRRLKETYTRVNGSDGVARIALVEKRRVA
jgi:hypothetical protein